MSTSSEAVDETGAASSDPCEWGRRADAAPVQEWSAVTKTRNWIQYMVYSTDYIQILYVMADGYFKDGSTVFQSESIFKALIYGLPELCCHQKSP